MEFYRWLRTPSSLFYDPLLHRMVHRLMKKVFMQLMAQFKRFGAKIIYASFDRIILEQENRIENVIAYITSCLDSISKQDLFEWLIINPINSWDVLFGMIMLIILDIYIKRKNIENAENTIEILRIDLKLIILIEN